MIKQRLANSIPNRLRPAVRRAVVRTRYVGLGDRDLLLVSYPKSGSTWLRFLLAHALSGAETNFDAVRRTFPPLGRHRRAPAILPRSARAVRTHEPLDERRLGGHQTRVIYLARDARPLALSYARHKARVEGDPVDPTVFIPDFLDGTVDSYGPWHEHVRAGLAFGQGHPASFSLVRFEDLQSDTAGTVAAVLAFLEAEPAVDLDTVVAANTADRMRAKEAQSEFLQRENRDGSTFVSGGDRAPWDEVVPVELRRRFEAVVGEGLRALGYPLEFGSAP